MSSPLPPDPYDALSLPKDATSAQIKSTYRKLVLKCHPDKVTDPLLKEKAADDFHRIQQAYEILGDDDRRSRYDAQVKLAELRKDVMEKQRAAGPRTSRTSAYDMPSTTASTSHGATYTSRGPERGADRIYEERKPTREADYEYFPDVRCVPRKHDDYDRSSKKVSPRDDRDRVRIRPSARSAKESARSSRDDRKKTKDKETKRERENKFSSVIGDDTDPEDLARRAKYDRRREEELKAAADREYREKWEREKERERIEREKDREAESQRYAAQARKQRESSFRDDSYDDRSRKPYASKEDDKYHHARSYIEQAERGSRPSASRTTSTRDTPYLERTREGTPVLKRHSSVRPGRSSRAVSPPPLSSKRERGERKHSVPDVADYPESRDRTSSHDRRVPSLQTSTSSPPVMNSKSMRERGPMRSHSLQTDFDHPPPQVPHMMRSDTMPNLGSTTSPRRKEASAPLKSSNLRNTEINEGLPTPSTTPEYASPVTPHPSKCDRYGEVDVDYANRKRPIYREPVDYERERRPARGESSPPRQRAPSSRYPVQAPAPPPPIRTQTVYPYSAQTESPTSYSSRPSPIHRGASELYGEVPRAAAAATMRRYAYPDREAPRQMPPDAEVSYGKKFGHEDARMQTGYTSSSRRGGSSSRPGFGRAATYQATAGY